MEDYELRSKKGYMRFTHSRAKLEELKLEKLRSPQLETLPNGNVVFKNTLFIEYED